MGEIINGSTLNKQDWVNWISILGEKNFDLSLIPVSKIEINHSPKCQS